MGNDTKMATNKDVCRDAGNSFDTGVSKSWASRIGFLHSAGDNQRVANCQSNLTVRFGPSTSEKTQSMPMSWGKKFSKILESHINVPPPRGVRLSRPAPGMYKCSPPTKGTFI